MSDNLVKDYLEEISVVHPDQYINSYIICEDEWEVYRISEDTVTYVKYELTGKIGYAFCVTIICKRLTVNLKAFYYVKSYGNEVKEEWDCEQSVKDALISNSIGIVKPF